MAPTIVTDRGKESNGRKEISVKLHWSSGKNPRFSSLSMIFYYHKLPPQVDVNDPTLAQALRKAIPLHCFEKNLSTSNTATLVLLYFLLNGFLGRSLYYMGRDLAIVAVLYYFRAALATNWFNYLLWANLVGFFGWAMFVVGHDCGHGTFSNYWLVNQICGHIMHTPILVPFNGWQISHWKHHRHHNNIGKDESWKPMTKNGFEEMTSTGVAVRRSPLILFMYPWYLYITPVLPCFLNLSSLNSAKLYLLSLPDHPLLSGSHFYPWSRLFSSDQRLRAGISSVSVIAFLGFIFYTFPLSSLVWYYFVPYLIFTAWLSLVTLLQHTDPKGRYYEDSKWNFSRGAMTTFDRSFGGLINHLHHNIETHLVHHFFFTAIPHYHLVEATEAVKPLLGSAYPYDDTNIVMAFWNTVQNCDYIHSEFEDGVFEYRTASSS